MTIQEYQQAVKRTVNQGVKGKDERIKNFCFGLGGETGELLDLFKKHFYHGHKLNENKVKNEMGDVLWYIANIANEYNFSLTEIMEININKLRKRYPNGFSEEESINRNI